MIKIIFAGDLAPLGAAESSIDKKYALRISDEIKELFNSADLRIVNLETPLTLSETRIPKTGPHVKAHPESIRLLKDINVNIACLSNNHIRDYDSQGVYETIKVCNEQGIKTLGAGSDLADAATPLILEIKDVSIAFLNFSESEFNYATPQRAGSNPDDPVHIWQSVSALKGKVDHIFVVMHGGREMHPLPTPSQVDLYRFIIDIGADAVIGHHSHVIGGWESYKSKPIFYSLGNFIFDDHCTDPAWFTGAVVQLLISKTGEISFQHALVQLDEAKLKLLQPFAESSNSGKLSALKHISTEEVSEAWKKQVRKYAMSTAKSLLNPPLQKRILNKLGLFRLSNKDVATLIRMGNQLSCRTHRDMNIDAINHLLEKD